nr:MAG TPA: hypothetical protein [Caudoviricetes sp.]
MNRAIVWSTSRKRSSSFSLRYLAEYSPLQNHLYYVSTLKGCKGAKPNTRNLKDLASHCFIRCFLAFTSFSWARAVTLAWHLLLVVVTCIR